MGSLSCPLPRGLYSSALSVWNGVNNLELFSPMYHMDIDDTVELNAPSNIPPCFLLIDESWAHKSEVKVQHSEIKKPQSCCGAMPSSALSPALFITREEFWIQRLSCHFYYYY